MNTQFKVKLTPKDDKAVYSQSLPMAIHLKEDLIVELALSTNMESSQYYRSQITQVPYLTEGTQQENTSPCGSQKNLHTDSG